MQRSYRQRDGHWASIRVNEVFAQCPRIGLWADKPAGNLLAFVTTSDNVNLNLGWMGTRPKKHIGIYYNNTIHHYSNVMDRVITQMPEMFAKHYKVSNVELYFGTFPTV